MYAEADPQGYGNGTKPTTAADRGWLPSSARGAEKVTAANSDTAGTSPTKLGPARFAFLEEGRVAVIEIFEFGARNLLADEALDGLYMTDVFGDH